MTTTVIPAKSVTTCDRCGIECNDTNRRRLGHLHLSMTRLDNLGDPAAGDGRHWDFCDDCLGFVSGALKTATARPKK